MAEPRLLTAPGAGSGPTDRAVFLRGICTHCRPPYEHTAVVTERQVGRRIDEPELHRIVAYLKAQPEVARCGQCERPITTWSADLTTFGAYRGTERRAWGAR